MRHRDEAETYRLGLVVLDAAFDRARERLNAPCRRGCSACCESAGLFEIHAADAALLAVGLATLDPGTRASTLRRASEVAAEARRAAERLAGEEPLLAGWAPADGLGGIPSRVVQRLAEAVGSPCPLLADAECLLHEHRPAICRLQGIPWRDPDTGAELPDFCRLEERQAGMPPQDAPLHGLDELREGVRARLDRAGRCGPGRTFVAAALLAGEGTDPVGGPLGLERPR